MNTDESRKIYSLRKITVEPVYGHIKQNLGFRNLGKIWRMMRENRRSTT